MALSQHQLLELCRKVQVGYALAQEHLASRRDLPWSDSRTFIEILSSLHRIMFGSSGISTLGRFRRHGEDVFIDHGVHGFMGVPASEVEPRLHALFDETLGLLAAAKGHSPGAAFQLCAEFLEGFFAIHPYLDGNGRVARLIVEIQVRVSAGRRCVWPSAGRRRRQYFKALRHCHKRRLHPHLFDTRATSRKQRTWLLREWLERISIPDGEDVDIPPPGW
jgi:fido (protein-threonine AMPylation protein)